MTKLGVYAGPRSHVDAFGVWLNRPIEVAVEFPRTYAWSDVQARLHYWEGASQRMSLSVAMLAPGTTLARGALGEYDSYWTTFAEALVARGFEDAILRVGWEFNGDWFPWRAASHPKEFRRYWRRIVRAMRAVAGQKFKFDWCPIFGPFEMGDPTDAYPGDEYVDYIGLDIYDKARAGNPQASWAQQRVIRNGFDFWERFATEQGKRFSVPEWGVVTTAYGGIGDDVYFIEQMHKWITAKNPAYHCYFNQMGGLGTHVIALNATYTSTPFPKAAARFRQLFAA